jgi:hypothetical protein
VGGFCSWLLLASTRRLPTFNDAKDKLEILAREIFTEREQRQSRANGSPEAWLYCPNDLAMRSRTATTPECAHIDIATRAESVRIKVSERYVTNALNHHAMRLACDRWHAHDNRHVNFWLVEGPLRADCTYDCTRNVWLQIKRFDANPQRFHWTTLPES